MKKRIVAMLAALGAVVAAGGLVYSSGWMFRSGGGAGGQGDPSGASSGEVHALGRIEPAGGVIGVAAPMGDRILRVLAREGQRVAAGQPLAELDSRELRELERQVVRAQLTEAQARWKAEEQSAAARIRAAELALEEAESHGEQIEAEREKVEALRLRAEQARRDAERLAALGDELVTAQQRERQTLLVRQAEAEWSAARAALALAETKDRLARENAQAQLDAARAAKDQVLSAIPVESLAAQYALVDAQLRRAWTPAPTDGVVLKILGSPGDLTGGGPILQMADTSRMAVIAEVHEDSIKRIRVGQSARITSRALPAPYDREDRGLTGRVERIGRIVASPALKSLNPFAADDLHVIEVRVALDDESSRVAARFVAMQVDVHFLADSAAAPATDDAGASGASAAR